ncbi:hypothetical protein IWX65_002686 [Arthrobacter sp. CAN_A214]
MTSVDPAGTKSQHAIYLDCWIGSAKIGVRLFV